MNSLSYLYKWALYGFLVIFMVVVLVNVWVVKSVEDQVIADIEKLPDYDVALVLGTSPFIAQNVLNPFYEYRIQAATDLYHKGKIKRLIVSGDNRTIYYNEPQAMFESLIALGVPDSVITLDHAGIRTFDSVVRSKKVFDIQQIIIITQAFHAYRSLFISNYYNLEAVVYVAEHPNYNAFHLVYWREYLARIKAVIDLYLFVPANSREV